MGSRWPLLSSSAGRFMPDPTTGGGVYDALASKLVDSWCQPNPRRSRWHRAKERRGDGGALLDLDASRKRIERGEEGKHHRCVSWVRGSQPS